MAIDASIYQNVGRGVKSYQDYNNEADAAKLNKLQLMSAQSSYDQGQQGIADQNALREAAKGFGDDTSANYRSLLSRGLVKPAQEYQKSTLDNQKTQGEIGHVKAQTTGLALDQSIKAHDYHIQQLGAVADPSQIPAWVDAGVKSGVFTPEQGQQGLQRAQQAISQPGGFAAWKQQALQGGVTATEQLKLQQQKLIADNTNLTSRQNNADTNKTHIHTTGMTNATTRRGQDLVDDRSGQAMNTPQYMETDAGIVALPRKLPNGEAPVGIPVTTQDGSPLTKAQKLKDIPPAVNAKIIEGTQAVTNIDAAIAAVKANKGAFGLVNAIPGAERMRQGDTNGVDARAQVANIGSLTLHDRSGAAVSASEFPRLAPFIPTASDSADAIVTKLSKMKKIAEDELGLFAGTYGEGTGYKPNPVLNRKPTEAAAPASANLSTAEQAELAALKKRFGK